MFFFKNRKKYGADSVIATDIKKADDEFTSSGPFIYADALDYRSLEKIVVENKVDWVVHFTALLSAVGENNVEKAINVNVNTFLNVLQLGKFTLSLKFLFVNSLIFFFFFFNS